MNKNIFVTKPLAEYALLDSGEGMKLERYGNIIVSRPDPQALWHKRYAENVWRLADAIFVKESRSSDADEKGRWILNSRKLRDHNESWIIPIDDMSVIVRLTPFKHTGVFPEQHSNWQWCRDLIEARIKQSGVKPKILNLFGYTGIATVSALMAGASVTHVDASKAAVTWTKENVMASGGENFPMRLMLEDAMAFIKREIRRGNTYDGIIMDPPSFGRGAQGELWRIEKDFLPLLECCLNLMSETPLFFVTNGYASGYSSIAYENAMHPLIERFGGNIESGELAIQEEDEKNIKEIFGSNLTGSTKISPRLLPCGIVSRWKIK